MGAREDDSIRQLDEVLSTEHDGLLDRGPVEDVEWEAEPAEGPSPGVRPERSSCALLLRVGRRRARSRAAPAPAGRLLAGFQPGRGLDEIAHLVHRHLEPQVVVADYLARLLLQRDGELD